MSEILRIDRCARPAVFRLVGGFDTPIFGRFGKSRPFTLSLYRCLCPAVFSLDHILAGLVACVYDASKRKKGAH